MFKIFSNIMFKYLKKVILITTFNIKILLIDYVSLIFNQSQTYIESFTFLTIKS